MDATTNNNDAVVPDDLPPTAGDASHCSQHPYRSNLGGGICASCLKEKLGKLVSTSSSSSSSSSSSFPLPLRRPPYSSSSSSSAASPPPSSDLSSSSKPPNLDSTSRGPTRQPRIPGFLYSKKKNNSKYYSPSSAVLDRATELAFRRSNTAPKRPEHTGRFLDTDILEYSPRKKGFWSFLYLSAGNNPLSSASRQHYGTPNSSAVSSSSTSSVIPDQRAETMMPFSNDVSKRCAEAIPEDDDLDGVACDGNNLERKVSRSRSVGCGSRSFSGDFFERISTGFGDCTFRRVESQREQNGHGHTRYRVSSAEPDYRMKERVRCSRIFGGFMMASSSSSLSSSSYWITSSTSEDHRRRGGNGVRSVVPAVDVVHGRSRSWGGWVFASPMRAFGRPSSKGVKRGNAAPNLNSIPSLLTVGS